MPQTVHLATQQYTGETIDEVNITVCIWDVETNTTAFVSDDTWEEAILGVPWLTEQNIVVEPDSQHTDGQQQPHVLTEPLKTMVLDLTGP
ncbi:hypothetical protein PR048_003112 [Dryococelus australis]|uniref:MHC class I antigen n=1 Tax=Dryococelus australis TaxID=614101 RepID=A0ABQ9IM53_9NEOP|nr:hypothetical protein PR048_003112 [Dryococelus australis]